MREALFFNPPDMAETSTLLIQKKNIVYDTLADFGFATGEIPFPAEVEIKEFATRSCPGEDGDRVFFPDTSYASSYDWDVEFKYRGDIGQYRQDYEAFISFLNGRDGNGTEISVYSPFHRIGRQKVNVKEISDAVFKRMGDSMHLTIKVKFRINDPLTHILLGK